MGTAPMGIELDQHGRTTTCVLQSVLDDEANGLNVLLIIDTDNVGGNRQAPIRAVRRHLGQAAVSRCQVEVVGRSRTAGEEFAKAVQAELPWATVQCHPAPSAKDGADAMICYLLGRFVGGMRASRSNAFAYVLTRDNAIRNAALLCLADAVAIALPDATEAEMREGVLSIEIGDARPKLQPTQRLQAPALPEWWKPDLAVNGTHLCCIESPSTGPISPPFSAQFPRRCCEVTLGFGLACALDFSPWDAGKGGLYNPHVTFTYTPHPHSEWKVRAMKGMRRGKRRVVVAQTHVDAGRGSLPILAGTRIEIGDFVVEFRPNRLTDIADLEDPMVLIGALERKLKSAAVQLPSAEIPQAVRDELSDSSGGVDWERAYFRHFETVFAAAWSAGDRSTWPQGQFASLTSLRRIFGRLNRLRNVVMHPVRGDVGQEDRQKLAEAFCLLWPQS